MSDRHESHVATVMGGRLTKASGATTDKGDGRHGKGVETYEFAWDAKSTRGASTSVKLSDWNKIVDQTPGYRPMVPLRFYRDDRLTSVVDLAVVDLNDIAELAEQANLLARIKEQGCLTSQHDFPGQSTCTVCGISAYDLPDAES